MPRWWTPKRGRRGRPLAPWPLRKPFPLIVDANGAPFAVRVGAGNQNERHHLLPLLDALLEREIVPAELWADRGYDGEALREQTRRRGLEPVISRRRRRSDPPPPAGSPTRLRGNRRRAKPPDPNGRYRWPVERTNSWLRNWRRVSTRWERRPDYWLAVIQAAAALVAWQSTSKCQALLALSRGATSSA